MKEHRRAALVFSFLFWVLFASAQPNPIPFQTISSHRDHADFPWKVIFHPLQLTYGQQYQADVTVFVPAELFQFASQQQALYFMIKVQNDSGNWLPGAEYNIYQQPYQPTMDFIECKMKVYLRPGKYTIAVIAYESASKKANIKRHKIVVRPIKNDNLPELDTLIPLAEFTNNTSTSVTPHLLPLVISTAKKIRVDLVVSFFDRSFVKYERFCSQQQDSDSEGQRYEFTACYPPPSPTERVEMDRSFADRELSDVLSLASMISRFRTSNGCTFLTVVDPYRMKVRVHEKAAEEVNWAELQKALANYNQDPIPPTGTNQLVPAKFMYEVLEKYGASGASCGSESVEQRIVVVISWRLNFQERETQVEPLAPMSDRVRFYYFRPPTAGNWPLPDNLKRVVNSNPPLVSDWTSLLKYGSPVSDDLKIILAPAKASIIEYETPEELRRGLGHLVSDMRRLGN